MKGLECFPDAEEWRFKVIGDWSPMKDHGESNGAPETYTPDPRGKYVWFGGGVGFFHYLRGEFAEAVEAWEREVATIVRLEQEEGRRYHKGWFYFMIGEARARQCMAMRELAKEEDRLSYAAKAKDFPAAQVGASG